MSDNSKIEKQLDEAMENKESQKLDLIMGMLQEAYVFVPAIIPDDINPELMNKLEENAGKEGILPDGIDPKPCILENDEGEQYLAVFTSPEQIPESPQYPLQLNMPFQACIETLEHVEELTGIVINPYTHNMVLNFNHNQENVQESDSEKMIVEPDEITEAQLHAIMRQKIESHVLPVRLFKDSEKEIAALCEKETGYIMDVYKELYNESDECPYVEDDFEYMILTISDSLELIRITMPEEGNVPGTCPMVMIMWNPMEKTVHYYAVVKNRHGAPNVAYRVLEDGSTEMIGEAPDEGSELSYFIDLEQE